MVKLNTVPNVDQQDLNYNLAKAAADIKNCMGIVLNVAHLVLCDTIDELVGVKSIGLEPHPDCRLELKRKTRNLRNIWNNFFAHLRTNVDSSLRLNLFSVEHFEIGASDELKENITTDQYFELWQATGWNAYQAAYPLIQALHHKFDVLNVRYGIPNAKKIAWLDVTGILISLACNVFNERCCVFKKNILKNIVTPTPAQLFRLLNPEELSRTFFDVRDQYGKICANDDEIRNLSMTADDIRNKLLFFDNVVEYVNKSIQDYSEYMKSKGHIKKVMIRHNELIEQNRKRMLALRLQQMQQEERLCLE